MNRRSGAGILLMSIAIGTCVLLGTLGWFMVAFGMMTDCTNDYSCTTTGCPPCDPARRWLDIGAVVQLALAGLGIAGLVRARRRRVFRHLGACGVALLVTSAVVITGTTRQAQQSYCQPGTPGYAGSYCDVHG